MAAFILCRETNPHLQDSIESCLGSQHICQLFILEVNADSNSLDIISENKKNDNRLMHISDDISLINALLKSRKLLSAELTILLTSSDVLESTAINNAINCFNIDDQLIFTFSDADYLDNYKNFINSYPTLKILSRNLFLNSEFTILHSTIICKSNVFSFFLSSEKLFINDIGFQFTAFLVANYAKYSFRLFSVSVFRITNKIDITFESLLDKIYMIYIYFDYISELYLKKLVILYLKNNIQSTQISTYLNKNSFSLPNSFEVKVLALIDSYRKLIKFENLQIENINLPNILILILSNRNDLIQLNYHKKSKEGEFCQWLLIHGFKEYPNILKDKYDSIKLLNWLSLNSSSSSLPRLIQAIYDSTALHQQRWHLPRDTISYIYWLKTNWTKLPYNLPNYNKLNFSIFSRIITTNVYKITLIYLRFFNYIKYKLTSKGVNVLGYFNWSLGVGEDARKTYLCLRANNIPLNAIDIPPYNNNNRFLNSGIYINRSSDYYATIICLTADETIKYILDYGFHSLRYNYVIGYWPWELTYWPKRLEIALEYVDEIWVSTSHIAASLIPITRKPIKVMPLSVEEENSLYDDIKNLSISSVREEFDLNVDAHIYLISFDFNSSLYRKNPLDGIKAFQKAFPYSSSKTSKDSPLLVLKTFDGEFNSSEWNEIIQYIELDSRIKLIKENMSRYRLLSLYWACDSLISLHKAEGFGRVIAEAFQLGLNVIATNWSGNIDFCDGPLYFPVDFQIVNLEPDDYKFWVNQQWANPNLNSASEQLRLIQSKNRLNNIERRRISKHYIDRFSFDKCGKQYVSRLSSLNLI